MGNKGKYYLDNAATMRLSEDFKIDILKYLWLDYNPSAIYQSGKNVRNFIEIVRDACAAFIVSEKENIYFTSSGSAANTLAIKGYIAKNDCTVFYLPTMHKSALLAVKASCENPIKIPISDTGLINLNRLDELLSCSSKKPFVVIEYANSEIGTIQNVVRVTDIVHRYGGVVYVDMTAAISTIFCDVDYLNVDMAGFSGHKIGALKGIAVLYKKPEIQLEPLIYGSQERGLIGGTENTLGIYSLYHAIKAYCDNHIYSSISSYNCKYILNYLNNYVSDIFLLGEPIGKNRLAHNLFLLIKGVDGEQLLTLLDEYNIQVSTGSACNSGSKQPSNTLLELGIPEEYLHSCIRLTFDGNETDDDLDYIGKTLVTSINKLRMFT